MLEKDKIDVDVINARFAAPIDEKIISLVQDGKSIITVEDHSFACGFGSAVLEKAAKYFKNAIPKPIIPLAAPTKFINTENGKRKTTKIGALRRPQKRARR